jgi:hypothetical protein
MLRIATIAAIVMLTTAAHAQRACFEKRQTDDNFLAVRERPTTKSKIVWALRENEAFYTENKDWKKRNWVLGKT